jgi:glycosyltransferase involved in cell wall biosynthesis
MWNSEKISIIFPTYNEKDSIRQAIEDMFATGYVDEVIVVNNNAADGTSEEVAQTDAIEIFEERQGYGRAIRTGLEKATGDLLIISEPDGTFSGHDVKKLLPYTEDFDYVLGTRTTQCMIWKGANMGFSLKWGNWVVAKLAEFLFNGTMLTDCGCSMRCMRRDLYEEIAPCFISDQSAFGFEMTLHVLCRKMRYIEIPVNYRERVGVSAVTGSLWKTTTLALRMMWMIVQFRFLGKGKHPPRT